MKNYKNILFDLDGTLIDPKEGITNSVKYALKHFGIEVKNTEDLYKFIGPPLGESFSAYYGLDKEETETAIAKYREYFREKGIFQHEIYAGIPELLCELVKADKKVILATSKPEIFASQILESTDLIKYFSFVCGSELDGTRVEKADVIHHILKTQNLNLSDTVMIGDRSHDIIGAKKTNVDSIGVLYGYGSYEEFEESGATYIVKDIEELRSRLL